MTYSHATALLIVGGAIAAAIATACGPSVHVGLSNSPSVTRQSQPKQAHDAVANGPEASGSSATNQAPPPIKH